jgi:hypothetical protein
MASDRCSAYHHVRRNGHEIRSAWRKSRLFPGFPKEDHQYIKFWVVRNWYDEDLSSESRNIATWRLLKKWWSVVI